MRKRTASRRATCCCSRPSRARRRWLRRIDDSRAFLEPQAIRLRGSSHLGIRGFGRGRMEFRTGSWIDERRAGYGGGTVASQSEPHSESGRRPFADFLRYFLGLGTWGFGGPIATVGYMQRDLVERRRWLERQDFLNGVALGQTMPGPLAAQVVMWVGYLQA